MEMSELIKSVTGGKVSHNDEDYEMQGKSNSEYFN
jgi:hypothetical protein